MLFALTAVGASAAELFAPAEYKPSSFFKPASEITNFQECREASGILIGNNPRECRIDGKSFTEELEEEIVVTNFEECVEQTGIVMESYPEQCVFEGKTFTREIEEEIQPLVADEDYDVVVIEECDLAVRFPKKLIFTKDPFSQSEIYLIQDSQNLNGKMLPATLYTIECGNEKYEVLQSMPTEKNFIDESGLDISQAKDLQRYKTDPLGGIGGVGREFIGSETTIFTKNNTYYSLSKNKYSQTENYPIQLQFNSLAPSTPSRTLESNQTPTTGSNSNTPAKKTYTNPTYPNLKINYNDSWNMRVVRHSEQHYQDIEDVSVILQDRNSDVSLQFDLFVKIPTGCGGGGESDEKKVKQINNDLARYFDEYSNSYFYVQGDTPDTFSSSCKVLNHTLTSNLSRGELTANHPYFQNFPQDNLLEGRIGMTLTGSDSLGISKADQLVASSVFR